jgi:hypothetical protein
MIPKMRAVNRIAGTRALPYVISMVCFLVVGGAEAVGIDDALPAGNGQAEPPAIISEVAMAIAVSTDAAIGAIGDEVEGDDGGLRSRREEFDGDEEEYEAYEEKFEEERRAVDALIKLGMRIGAGTIGREEAWKEIRADYEEEEPEDIEEIRHIIRLGVKIAEGKMTEEEAWFLIFNEGGDQPYENIGRQIREAVAQGTLTATGSAEIWQALKSEAAKVDRE